MITKDVFETKRVFKNFQCSMLKVEVPRNVLRRQIWQPKPEWKPSPERLFLTYKVVHLLKLRYLESTSQNISGGSMSVPLGCSPQLKKLALSALKGRREGVKSRPWRQTAEVQYQAALLTSSTHCWASYSPLCLSFLICKKPTTLSSAKCLEQGLKHSLWMLQPV